MAKVSITRRTLYARVWSEPTTQLASEFGLSDVGLAKVCRRHTIPRPPRGYWAKRTAGQNPSQTPLPNPDDDSVIEIRESCTPQKDPLPAEVHELIQSQCAMSAPIAVRDHLRGGHPLVSRANQQLQLAQSDSEGFLIASEEWPLNLRVSKATMRRALLIVDALLRTLEERGHTVTAGPCVQLLDVSVRFRISEGLETRQDEPDEPDLTDRYQFGHSRFRKIRQPSGKLTLQIDDATSRSLSGCRCTWRDTPKLPLEQRLDSVIAGMLEYAARIRQYEEQRRIDNEARRVAEQRRQEEARQRALKRKAIEAEQQRVDALLQYSRDWKCSQVLREFIEAARRQYLAGHPTIESDSEMAQWLEWAERQAERLDPLVASPPSILDETVEDEATHDRRRYGSW